MAVLSVPATAVADGGRRPRACGTRWRAPAVGARGPTDVSATAAGRDSGGGGDDRDANARPPPPLFPREARWPSAKARASSLSRRC